MGELVDNEIFDEAWYRKTYPDVDRALRSGLLNSARDHYVNYGRAEGRRPAQGTIEFIIHVGPHKTGTTYIQASLKKSRAALATGGVLFPNEWWLPDGNPSHFELFRSLRDSRFDRIKRDLEQMRRASVQKVVISSEDLSDLSPDEIQHLRSCLGTDSAIIVIYYRRWSDRLFSGWKEEMQHGHSRTLPQFMAAHLGAPHRSSVISTNLMIDAYCNVFGRENVKLVCFDELVSNGTDIFRHFSQTFLGVDFQNWVPEKVNVSLSWTDGELARALNGMSSELWPLFLKRRKTVDFSCITDAMKRHTTSLAIDERDPSFMAIHDHMFAEFSDLFVDPKPQAGLFKPELKTVRYINPDYLLEPGISGAYADLAQSLRQT